MHTRLSLTLALSTALAAAASGCTSAPTILRGQNPASDSRVTPASYGMQPHLSEAVADHIHGTKISHYNVPTQGLWASASEATCPPSSDCPHCKGSPPVGQACPICQCEDHGHHHHFFHRGLIEDYPEHHFTYSYMRPKNLQYPPPHVPGGIVVYPYYTLKGPSDFFRD
jgi:hypothetical protein